MPESCVFWQRGGNDVDRRGNNNENTIKSRLHGLLSLSLSGKKQKCRETPAGCGHKNMKYMY